jgi:DNA (cytosine-5)-methyltransferase 1
MSKSSKTLWGSRWKISTQLTLFAEDSHAKISPQQAVVRAWLEANQGCGGNSTVSWLDFRPAWVVVENVAGMLSSRRGWDMGAILRSLGDLGYWWAYRVLDAQWFGLPQRRKRVFIVGHIGDRTAPAKVLLEPEGCPRDSAEGCGEEGHKVIGAFTSSVREADIADTLVAHYAKSPTTAGRDSSVRNVVLDPTGRVRRLTPLECERLQGFPDGWTCLCEAQGNTERCRCPITLRYRVLGKCGSCACC